MNLHSSNRDASSKVSPVGFHSDEALSAASSAARPHCDPKSAIQRLAGAVDLYRELLMSFFRGADESVGRIRSAAEQGNAEEVHRGAHQLRGVAATCGALGVVRVTDNLEQLGRRGDLVGSRQLCDELDNEMQIARRELNSYIAPL